MIKTCHLMNIKKYIDKLDNIHEQKLEKELKKKVKNILVVMKKIKLKY